MSTKTNSTPSVATYTRVASAAQLETTREEQQISFEDAIIQSQNSSGAKLFKLEQLLTITTGLNLVSDLNHLDELVTYMLGVEIYAHEMPAALILIKPYILAQHPNLTNAEIPKVNIVNCSEVIKNLYEQYGEDFPLNPIPQADIVKFKNNSIAPKENFQARLLFLPKIINFL
ncbi:MAG: hypothetical protein FWE22_00880 [Firmicutes bacterium]|nr:hypothetical protein [Bacillota bacterium]